MTHPLTNKKLFKKFWDYTCDAGLMGNVLYTPDGMRAAADWQLEQVMEWLDEHLTNYSDDAYRGSCESINDLEDHLKKAMRTTQEKN